MTTLSEALRAVPPDAPFLLLDGGDWTYRDLDRAADRFATALVGLGVRRGDRIAVAAPNGPEWLVTWFGAARIGAVLVTLNVGYREREFEYMLTESGAVLLVCAGQHGGFDFVDFLGGLRDRLPTVRHYVFLGASPGAVGGFPGALGWADLAATPVDPAALDATGPVGPDDPAVILYTSGTTGEPKGAVLTHGSILASATAQTAHLGQTAEDVLIGHMPLNHVGGMTCSVAATMIAGGSVALLPGYHPRVALEIVARRGVSIFVGVPTMYSMMLGLPEFAEADTGAVRTCVVGGSNVEPELARRIVAAFPGARLANLYGLSETSGGCVISAEDDDLDNLVESIGIGIGGFDVQVTDDRGRALPVGEVGELCVRGTCLATGYWNRPDDSDATFRSDGWLATGDMASLDAAGRVRLRGRKKEMYVRGGYNVYPAEVENVLAGDPSVAMGAVIGVPDPVFGEVGRAYVVPAPGQRVDVDALLERCRRLLAAYKVPDQVRVVDELPLTPAGKIKKVALRALA